MSELVCKQSTVHSHANVSTVPLHIPAAVFAVSPARSMHGITMHCKHAVHAPFNVSNILRPSSRMPLCLRICSKLKPRICKAWQAAGAIAKPAHASTPVFVRDPLLNAIDLCSSLLCGIEVDVHVLQAVHCTFSWPARELSQHRHQMRRDYISLGSRNRGAINVQRAPPRSRWHSRQALGLLAAAHSRTGATSPLSLPTAPQLA